MLGRRDLRWLSFSWTGASSGLGRDTAAELLEQGHDVVVHGRRLERFASDDLPWRGTVTGDLSDLAATQEVARQANEFGRFDAVIHNRWALLTFRRRPSR